MDGIKEWYNGYIFGGETVIYNPWSIVNYLSSPEEGLKPHWISTSDNRLVKEVIKLNRRDAIMTTEKLLRKEEVRKPLLTNIPYTQIESDPDVVWSFLLHSGYLKASEMHQEELGYHSWRLSIPNKEVETAWETVVRSWLKEDLSVNEDFTDFVSGIREANPRLIERGLKRILFGLASYYDSPRDEEDRRENFYHGLVLGLLAYLGSAYAVDSNREYGRGRSDIVVVRKGSDAIPPRPKRLLCLSSSREIPLLIPHWKYWPRPLMPRPGTTLMGLGENGIRRNCWFWGLVSGGRNCPCIVRHNLSRRHGVHGDYSRLLFITFLIPFFSNSSPELIKTPISHQRVEMC